jgi:hypothetical protein
MWVQSIIQTTAGAALQEIGSSVNNRDTRPGRISLESFAWESKDPFPWRLGLAVTLAAQIILGTTNVILLAPIWLQMRHFIVADLFWIPLVLASADSLFAKQHFSVSHRRELASCLSDSKQEVFTCR